MRAFTIEGEPKSKGRHRISGHRAFTPNDTASYENLVMMSYRQSCKDPMYDHEIPLVMQITAFYSIPKSVSKKKRAEMMDGKIRPTKKPDIDNLCKVVMDSLNKIAYYDDSQIVKTTVSKFYSDYPRVFVQIWTLEEYEKIFCRL